MKKELIAYILALTTITGCNDLKKKDENIVETFTKPNTNIEVIDDAYYSHSDSMSYDEYFDIKDDKDSKIENKKTTHQKITGQFYLVLEDSLVYDYYGNIVSTLEKDEKIILINNNINEYGYAYIQLSNGYKGYIDYSNLVLLSNQIIDLKHDYSYNSFNDNDTNNTILKQPIVYKFIKENNYLYDWNSEIICPIKKNDIVKIIDKNFNSTYIELTDGTRGFIDSNLLSRLPKSFAKTNNSEQTTNTTKVLIHK